MRVVIDTNVLCATLKKSNFERFIYDAFKMEVFEWVVSTEILNEYHEKLAEFYSVETANLVVNILTAAPNVILAEPAFRWNLISEDPDNNKFSDLAISTNAYFLVSYDRHFNIFKEISFPNLKVVKPKEFKTIINWA
ncbi:MAG: putative toxin-antitoxin system toxin component, PIN family [Runella zeae]